MRDFHSPGVLSVEKTFIFAIQGIHISYAPSRLWRNGAQPKTLAPLKEKIMRTFLIIAITMLGLNMIAKGQNLFFIGEKSYPCTNEITLKSNSNGGYDLNVFLAKDGKAGLFAVSTKSLIGEAFTGKIIIYLKDGNVLTCNNSEASENVDDRAIALYKLSNDQLNILKTSNIHTVKYTMTWLSEQNYSASNKGIETNALISEFFREGGKTEATIDDHLVPPDSTSISSEKKGAEGFDPFADGSFPEGTGTDKSNESNSIGKGQNGKKLNYGDFAGDGLFNRRIVTRANVSAIATVPGKVVLDICVNRLGKVTLAKFNLDNSTIKDLTVVTKAVDCAKQYVFDEDPSAPREQCGRLTFFFELK
jgi:hypothetical protein